MMSMINALFDPQVALSLFAFVAALATILAVALPFVQRDGKGARLKAIARRREELSKQQRERFDKARAQGRVGRRQHVALMQRILKKVNLQELAASKELRQRLVAAGYRSPDAPVVFLFVRLGATVILALFAFFVFAVSVEPVPLAQKTLWMIGALTAGFFLPPVLVKNKAQKRQDEMTLAFPDALDLLVICTESGLSIEGAFVRVTEEIQEASPVMSEEMGLTSAELAFLGDRRKAYTNLAERTGLASARALATALVQSEKYGTPVSQALKVLAAENRQERMSKAEKKAGALPAQLTVPMIIFFLPALFLAIIGPAIIQITNM